MAIINKFKKNSALPGFGITLGYTVTYLSLVVLIPLAGLFIKTASLSLSEFWRIISDVRVISACKLTFGAALLAALVNSIFGTILCWVLVRYNFPGKKIIDAVIDLPFALPTAIAGIALTALYVPEGMIGRYLDLIGVKIAFTPLGIVVALIFVGIPFVVRTIEPMLQVIDKEVEETATILGAGRWQVFTKIIFPNILPGLITGFALAFARGIGEYGSVIFIAGNIPNVSEIVPLIIATKLEQFDYTGATAIAVVMLIVSFIILLLINIIQLWSEKRRG